VRLRESNGNGAQKVQYEAAFAYVKI